MGFRKQTKSPRNYFDRAATPLPLSSVWLDCSTLLPLQQINVTAIIHAINPSTQFTPQIKRVFGSASGVDPLRLKKKTAEKMFHVEQNKRRANAQPQTFAPICENKYRQPTPPPLSFRPTQEPMKNKNTAPAKCSTWNTAAEIAAFILICITLGALLGANF